jgi:hypothetical protein
VARYWATADQRAVRVYRDGLVVAYRHGDFSGKSRGGSVYRPPGQGLGRGPVRPVEPDEVDHALEQLGYVAASSSSWKWVAAKGYYRIPVVPEASWRARNPVRPVPDLTYEQYRKTFGTPEQWVKRHPARAGVAAKMPQSPGRYRDEVQALRLEGW